MFEGSSELLRDKLSVMFTGLLGVAHQRSDTSSEMSQDNSRSILSYLPFPISWDAIALAETAQWRGERRDLPVRLFNILYTPYFLARVRKVNSLNCLGSSISAFIVEPDEQCSGSPVRVAFFRRLQKMSGRGFRTQHPNKVRSYFDDCVG